MALNYLWSSPAQDSILLKKKKKRWICCISLKCHNKMETFFNACKIICIDLLIIQIDHFSVGLGLKSEDSNDDKNIN